MPVTSLRRELPQLSYYEQHLVGVQSRHMTAPALSAVPERLARGLVQRAGRKIGLNYPPIFAVESLTLARRDKNYFWRRRFGECRCNDERE